MAGKSYDKEQLRELLYQAIETEAGGIRIYETALKCAINDDLKKEWTNYLKKTKTHHETLLGVFADLKLDPEKKAPGRKVVGHIGDSLVKAMEMALAAGDADAAQLVAGECVVLAETKDHLNWELIGHVARNAGGEVAKVLKEAYEKVEKDEDHHLYHTTGWTRELWIDALGLPAALPPPEEVKEVETAIGASRAEHAREDYIGK
ncbi:MAG: hypothetical protein CVT73_05825 [Alphaproteobacteria bacterium HGW-Alphaproteobacteria-12]|nr:MAG: hypothetical protein CVT73_05825 [Alphaproteobacteria bacterium HGW-Alphaproteobacteria-12]